MGVRALRSGVRESRRARGNVSLSQAMLLATVGLAGVGGFSAWGSSMESAIGTGGGVGVVHVAAMAGEAGPAPAPSGQAGASEGAPGTDGFNPADVSTSAGGNGTVSADELASRIADAIVGGGGCGTFDFGCHAEGFMDGMPTDGFMGGLSNFMTNMGMNPAAWVLDPAGQLGAAWNRVYGAGQYVWGTVSGVARLVDDINTFANPLWPGFWSDLARNGPGGFLDRRLGFCESLAEAAPGFVDFAWETSPFGALHDAVFQPERFGADREQAWNDFKGNAVVQALWEPLGSCAGTPSAQAQNACGRFMADVTVSALTVGWGKGAKGAAVADELAGAGDDVARVASRADDTAATLDDVGALADDVAGPVAHVPDMPNLKLDTLPPGHADSVLDARPTVTVADEPVGGLSGQFNDIYRAVGPNGEDIVIKARRAEGTMLLDDGTVVRVTHSLDEQLLINQAEAARARELERFGGPRVYEEVRLVDETGAVRPGFGMERIEGVTLQDAAVGRAGFPITEAHRSSYQSLMARLEREGVMFDDFHGDNLMLTPDGRVVPIDTGVVAATPGAGLHDPARVSSTLERTILRSQAE
jgi:hypothetical protein